MPVIWKISSIENGRFGFTVDPWEITITDYKEDENNIVCMSIDYEGGDKNEHMLSCYFEAVNLFLNWYNKQDHE